MKKYTVVCPHCGEINKDLYLEETDGWMECENCAHTVRVCLISPITKQPIKIPGKPAYLRPVACS